MLRSFCVLKQNSASYGLLVDIRVILNNLLIYNNFSKMSVPNSSDDQPKCLFCDIIKENDPNKILYEDEKVVVFPDIKPAAKVHYLIVTKEHIKDAKTLMKDQKPLVEYMVEIAKKMIEEKSDKPSDATFGFHWPPFTSISHLHLHAISPTSEESFLSRMIFKPDSWWFVTPEYVLKMLDNKL